GMAVAVDGNAIEPVAARRYPLGMEQRIDIRLRLPSRQGAWPVLALREGGVQQTGFLLATPGAIIQRLTGIQKTRAPALDLVFEAQLRPARNRKPAAPAGRKIPVVIGGGMDSYVWTINGKSWVDHAALSVRAGERVELAMRNDSRM